MKEKKQTHPSFQTDHEHVHAFFQDLGLALNRIVGLNAQENYVSYQINLTLRLPVPVESTVDSNHGKWPEEQVGTD